jgi:hypothetical protein
MKRALTPEQCLSCGRSDTEAPLLLLQLQSKRTFICPQCLPTLIHHPDRLTEKLLVLMQRAAGGEE